MNTRRLSMNLASYLPRNPNQARLHELETNELKNKISQLEEELNEKMVAEENSFDDKEV
jgi:hypothetical protein